MGSVKMNSGRPAAYGPRPARGNSALSRLSRARRDVLDALVSQPEPCTVQHIATALHQHHNTVREHLDGLRRVGLVTRHPGRAQGRGRPAWLYSATPAADDQGSTSDYAGLAAALASQIARSATDPVAEATEAGRHWGMRLAERAVEDTGDEPFGRLVTLLDDLGYAPEVGKTANEIRLGRCPLLAAANQHRDIVCGVHQGLVEGVLAVQGNEDANAQLVPFAEPGACLLHVSLADESPE